MKDHPTLNQQWTQFNKAYCHASEKAVSSHFTSKQILHFAFEEKHSAVSAHFTSKQKLPFAIQEYSDPENPWIKPDEHDGRFRKVIAPLLTTLRMLCQNFKLIR